MSELSYLKVFLDWRTATCKLSYEEQGRLINAMIAYASDEENADSLLTGDEAILFPVFKLQIDRDKAEIRKKKESNAENGKKGGAPKGNQNARKQPKTTETTETTETTQNNPKQPKQPKTKTTDNDEGLLTNDEDELNISCAEPSTTPHAPSAAPVFQVPLNDKTFFDVTADMITRWKELYPAVNVEQSMRDIVGWCEANPKQRKTRNGAMRFLNAWMAREQNKGGKGYQNRAGGGYGGNQGGYDWHNDPAYQNII